uniref:Uncharacterized protein n=1 Tax=virus sp. ctLpa4 TaxID=2825814 RepID=A0A8S5RME2_9VIRU|nr:MAG TPA: hypothetical protein [virus sp. ctLpa4]
MNVLLLIIPPFFASLPRVKTFSGKEIINNWVVSRHFEDNKRQIKDLP